MLRSKGWMTRQLCGWRDSSPDDDFAGEVDADVSPSRSTRAVPPACPRVFSSATALYAFNARAAAFLRIWADFEWNRWSPDDVALVALPVFHISGSGWGIIAAYAGALTIILPEFDHKAVIDAVGRFGVSKTVLVPATIQLIVDQPDLRPADFASMRNFLYGAAPISPPLRAGGGGLRLWLRPECMG